MVCKHCGKKLTDVLVKNKMPTNVIDCNCGSIFIDIEKEYFESIEEIKCANCGEYPFDKKPTIQERVKIIIVEDNYEI